MQQHLVMQQHLPTRDRPLTGPRPWLVAVAMIVVTLLTVVVAGPAFAHSALESADPQPGSTSTGAVEELQLRFGQAVDVLPSSVAVVTAAGPVEPAPTSVLQPDGVTAVAALAAPLQTGSYTVQWRVIGGDGHPIEGEYPIDVVAAASEAPSAQSDPDLAIPLGDGNVAGLPGITGGTTDDEVDAPGPAQDGMGTDQRSGADTAQTVARWVAFVGILTAVGVVVFGLVVHPDGVADRHVLTRLVLIGSVLAAAGGAVQLAAHVAVIAGTGAFGVLSGDAWGIVVGSGTFWAAVIRVSAASLLAVVVRRETWVSGSTPAVLAALGAAALVASFQLTGHTVTSAPSVIVRIADGAHIIGAAVWTGGVVALAGVMAARRRRGSPNDLIVGQFSVAATGAVVVVGLAGLALTVVELDTVSSLFTSAYGQVLLGKIAVVGVVGAVGGFNHRQLVPAIVAGHPAAAARMQRTMRIELALFPVVLALTAVLVRLSP